MRLGFSFGVDPDPTLNLSSTFPDLTDVLFWNASFGKMTLVIFNFDKKLYSDDTEAMFRQLQ